MQIQTRFISNLEIVQGLEHTRREWQQASEGESLLNLETNVGLFLADVSAAIGLTPEEEVLALGKELFGDVQNTVLAIPGDDSDH